MKRKSRKDHLEYDDDSSSDGEIVTIYERPAADRKIHKLSDEELNFLVQNYRRVRTCFGGTYSLSAALGEQLRRSGLIFDGKKIAEFLFAAWKGQNEERISIVAISKLLSQRAGWTKTKARAHTKIALDLLNQYCAVNKLPLFVSLIDRQDEDFSKVSLRTEAHELGMDVPAGPESLFVRKHLRASLPYALGETGLPEKSIEDIPYSWLE